jgi:phosphate transport system substrate-binding protein
MNIFNRMLFIVLLLVFIPATISQAEMRTITDEHTGLIWAGCGITKKAFMKELAIAYEKKTGVKIELQGGGATRGIRDVQSGKIDIGGACRAALEFNSKERFVKQIPLAWDAIVFIVNKNNPVDGITIDQVRDIYEGRITNWKQLGGNDAPVELYVRKSPISGVGQTLRKLVFKDREHFTSKAHLVKSSGPAEKAVLKSVNAFTATGISSASRRDVKMLKVNGVQPDYETIKNGSYMLYRPLYLVTKMAETNPLVKDFVKFATSDEGTAVIRKTGTVPFKDALNLLSKEFYQNSQ